MSPALPAMRVTLAPPLTGVRGDNVIVDTQARMMDEGSLPLGILSLAAVLVDRGLAPTIVDLDDLRPEPGHHPADRCEEAARRLVQDDPDVLGLGTLCSSYPQTLRIAAAVKAVSPETVIVLGGPQASAVAAHTLEAMPSVDMILRGEAEESLPCLLSALANETPLARVQGLSYRDGGAATESPDAPIITTLDDLPWPAIELHPGLQRRRRVPLEMGRGCPFACSFCSTSSYFSRRFRLRSPREVAARMIAIQRQHGVDAFDLVHDIFTLDRGHVVRFCQALLERDATLRWTCSSRTDQIDEELIELMASAGCTGIFLGLESGSTRLQRTLKKLDLPRARRVIAAADARGVESTVSLIAGFPDETRDDLGATLDLFVDLLRHRNASPQLHPLMPLSGSALCEQHRGRLVLDEPGLRRLTETRIEPADLALIRAHPRLFDSFHVMPSAGVDRETLHELIELLRWGTHRFKMLLVALKQRLDHVLNLFHTWRRWRERNEDAAALELAPGVYYASLTFARSFPRFTTELLEDSPVPAFDALVTYHTTFTPEAIADLRTDTDPGLPLGPDIIPRLSRGVLVTHLGVSYSLLRRCLSRGDPVVDIPPEPSLVAGQKSSDGSVSILKISPLSAELLSLCDGQRTADEILGLFLTNHPEPDIDGPPTARLGLVGLELLRREGVIVFPG